MINIKKVKLKKYILNGKPQPEDDCLASISKSLGDVLNHYKKSVTQRSQADHRIVQYHQNHIRLYSKCLLTIERFQLSTFER